MSKKDAIYDGLTIDLYIHRMKKEHAQWGNLAAEPVPRATAVAIINYYEEQIDGLMNRSTTTIDHLEKKNQELLNAEGTANRRVAAANARATKCQKKLDNLRKEMKGGDGSDS